VIGGDNIEGLLISSKQLPYKYLEVRGIFTSPIDIVLDVLGFLLCKLSKILAR